MQAFLESLLSELVYIVYINKNRKAKDEKQLLSFLKLDKENSHDYLFEKKINLSELPEEIRNPILKIPKINTIYICKKCEKIHYIKNCDINFNGEIYSQIVCPLEVVKFNSDNLQIIEAYLKVLEVKENINNPNGDIILPFETGYELFYFFLLVKFYHKIKDKIIIYNNGDIKQNIAFTIFENLLSNALYNKNENKICRTNLLFYSQMTLYDFPEFKGMNYDFFAKYNKIQVLPNGKRFYLKNRKDIKIDYDKFKLLSADKIEDYQFYDLCENIYCLIFTEEPFLIIKGPLENLDFNENSEKIIYVYRYSINYKNITKNNDKIISLYYILIKREIIHIDKNLFLGLDCIGKALYLIDLQNISLAESKLELNDKIKRIVSLKNAKNEDSLQFVLIGIQYIYLFEFFKSKSKYKILKEARYNNNERYFCYDINYDCYLLHNNILVFSFSFNNEIFFFNLKTFQLNTIIGLEERCEHLFKINNYEIICSTKDECSVINLKNKKKKTMRHYYGGMPYFVYDNQYFFCGKLIFDLKNDSYQQSYNTNIKDLDKILSYDNILINKNQFAFSSEYLSKNNIIKLIIDLYEFE